MAVNLFCNMWVCRCGFCNVWVCVCMGSVMCGCFDNCVGGFGNMCTCIYCVLVICVLVFTVFCIVCTVFVFRVCIFLFVTSVRTTATE